MGKNPRTSVLNGYCQAHEVKNLFALDCSVFTTYKEKNPVLNCRGPGLPDSTVYGRAGS